MNNIKVAWFLAQRQLFRNNKKSVALIVLVMTLTFLSLVAVSGILVGLIEGSSVAYRAKFTGDMLIEPLANKKDLPDTQEIVSILKSLPQVKAVSTRLAAGAQMESNYKNRDASRRRELASVNIFGINPSDENAVTQMSKDMLKGEFLNNDDTQQIILGKNTVATYVFAPQDKERALGDVKVGDKILVTINKNVNEFTVKGILNGKTDVTRQAFVVNTDLKKILDKSDDRATSISVRMQNPGQEVEVQKILFDNNLGENQQIKTYAQAEPTFVKDIGKMFGMIGNIFGAIGLITAVITIFIIIYINAVTRRKYIGIMKGIGISPVSIEISYILQSIFYGLTGSIIGALIVYLVLVPGMTAHPIDFPFSDGILVAPYFDTFVKFIILMFATVLAGYFPARSIVKGNTLNAILGR